MKFSTFFTILAIVLGAVLAALAVNPELGRAAAIAALVFVIWLGVFDFRKEQRKAPRRAARERASQRR